MRERMWLSVMLGWCVCGGAAAEAGSCPRATTTVQANVAGIAPVTTFAVPTIVSSFAVPTVTAVVPQVVVVTPSVTAASPLVVRQRIRVQSVPRFGVRSLLFR